MNFKHTTGPKTSTGKQAVASNSTSHGITSQKFLRCRKEDCYYFDLCLIKEDIDAVPLGVNCPIEVEIFHETVVQYREACSHLKEGERSKVVEELALLEIQEHRCNAAISLEGGKLIRYRRIQLSEGGVAFEPDIDIYIRYRLELSAKRLKLMKQIILEGEHDDQ